MKLSKKMLAIGTLATLPILPIAFSSCTNLSSENDLLRAKVSELNSTIENTKTKLDSLENENKQLDHKNKTQDVDAKVDMFKLRGEYASYISFINDNVVTKYDIFFRKNNNRYKYIWDLSKNKLLSWTLISKTNNKERMDVYTPAWSVYKGSFAQYLEDSIKSKTLEDIKKNEPLLSLIKKNDDKILEKYDITNLSFVDINLSKIFTQNYLENKFISKNSKEDLFKSLYIANDDLGSLLVRLSNKPASKPSNGK
ncbi:hypothetical protein [Mycoplasma bradburyae]|uniref:Lipoprotein n=1 Tax=Mycoplasma bradburyae TaxID=2963128 RepID=A0ABT5GA71_9MOLU|nr:hypothetical protein [Mycoplasma bradburyae]MDC4181855.1 hypothetical protein [Mycoplasma bradburyae]UTS70154.1 hypothetical protein NMG68_00125 [Mycoplasma bradburyae]